MPCDQIRLQRVELKKADLQVLGKAMGKHGLTQVTVDEEERTVVGYDARRRMTVEYDGAAEKLQAPSNYPINELKQAYSRELVEESGRRNGWSTAWTSKNEFEYRRQF